MISENFLTPRVVTGVVGTMSKTDSYLRRTVLAGVGLLAAGTVSASGDHKSEPKREETHSEGHGHSDKETRRCENCESGPESTYSGEKGLGVITIDNYSMCTRKVTLEVTGKVSEEPNPESARDGESTKSIHVAADSWAKCYFTGTVKRLDVEPGTVTINIEQHSTNEANSSVCHN